MLFPTPVASAPPAPLDGPALRASLEEAAQVALDAADRIIAVLDRMDGDADHEDGGDAEPSLAAPVNTVGSQVVDLRGNDQDREEKASEAVLPQVEIEPMPAAEPDVTVPTAQIFPRRGRGNVVAKAGSFLVDPLERA